MQADDRERLFRLYSIVLHGVPDADAAANLFMAARDEQDLVRRIIRWRRAKGLTPLLSKDYPDELDDGQKADALHLAKRAVQRRRLARKVFPIAIAMLLCIVAPITLYLRTVEQVSQGDVLTEADLPISLAVAGMGGQMLPADILCGDGEPELLPGKKASEFVLHLKIPFSPTGPDPELMSATLSHLPTPNAPGEVLVQVRANYATPESSACYQLESRVELPSVLKGEQVQLAISVSPGPGGGMNWTSRAVSVP